MKKYILMILVLAMMLTLIFTDNVYGMQKISTIYESGGVQINKATHDTYTQFDLSYGSGMTHGSVLPANKYEKSKINTETKITTNKNKVGTKTQVVAGLQGNKQENRDYISKVLVKEAVFNKNLKSYTTNIAYFFSEKGVLPPSKAIVNDIFNDKNGNKVQDAGELKIAPFYAIDYEDKLSKLEGENLLSDNTPVMDIRNMIALYLMSSSTFIPKYPQHGLIMADDVESYRSAVQSEVYKFPTNIPVYENGRFIASYNLAKDSHIVDGRNRVIEKFLKAYNESYDMAYYNNNRDEQGLRVKQGMGSKELIKLYPIFHGSTNLNGQSFKTVNNNFGGILDFELFAMSLNHVRTVIGFQKNANKFTYFNKITKCATLGRGIFDAPITNLLYTGGVANEMGKDFAEYVGYYPKPYEKKEVIRTLTNNGKFLDKPKQFGGLYLQDIYGQATKDEMVQSIKTGITEIDYKTEARSFNPEAVFGYYNLDKEFDRM